MENRNALAHATNLLQSFIESQEIPSAKTGTPADHGRKTAEFLTSMHQSLHEYFRKVDDAQ